MNDCLERGDPRPTARPAARPPRRERARRGRWRTSTDASIVARSSSCCAACTRMLVGANAARRHRVHRERAAETRAAGAACRCARRRAWADWRIAAAVTVLAIGSGSFAVLRQSGTTSSVTAPPLVSHANPTPVDSTNGIATRSIDTVVRVADNAGGSETSPAAAKSADEQTAAAGLATTARLADLNERQLQALLDQIDQLQAVPITDPEPVTIRVGSQSSSPEGA